MPVYTAHGLCLECFIPLPYLERCTGKKTDITIRAGYVGKLPDLSDAIAAGDGFRITNEGVIVFRKHTYKALVRGGSEIIVQPSAATDEQTLGAVILDLLGVLLHQRGRLVIHASAVAINAKAAIFMGKAGAGKSTLALALHESGHPFVADDLLSIDVTDDASLIYPAYPAACLLPETLNSLDRHPETLQQVTMKSSKRDVPAAKGFSKRPLPPKRVYVLAVGVNSRISPLPPREALFELVRNSYRAELAEGSPVARHLLQCASFAQSVPFRRLEIDHADSNIAKTASMVEKDLLESPT